jgi:hypothetical protein
MLSGTGMVCALAGARNIRKDVRMKNASPRGMERNSV